ncbi:C-type lectin domain family 4 member E [Larimichthys crocea]|uniref:Uncharacterized protein n=1 Tax=Larimichthys crocea TaxID=215358 RepID=A0ACD3Q7P0_LARCR|nr:C-type lectin domain family 4 member E [Larimichthys crocea]
MDAEYHQFGSPDSSPVHAGDRTTPRTGLRRMVGYVLYGVLVLLLLILLMVTGIKFTQVNQEISGIKLHLERIGQASSGVTVQVKKLVPVKGTCRERWVSFQRSCYLLSTNAVTWNEAEKQCQTLGGHLVVLNNVEELDYLSGIVEVHYNYWIGLVEREHEGHWSWVDGTNFNSTATFWDDGQPDDWDYRVNGEDCGQLHASEVRKRKLWNDAACNLKYQYICETTA